MTAPLAPRAPDALARPAARPGFFDGTRALFSGVGFVMTTPSIWPLAIVPVAIATLLTAVAGGVALSLALPPIAKAILAHVGERFGFLATLAQIVIGGLLLLVAAAIGFGVAQPLSGPALNRLVQRAEAAIGARTWPETSAAADILMALQSLAVAYGVGLPILAILWIVSFAFPPAAVVTFPLKLVVLGLSAAWDLLDYPLSIRGLPIGARISFVKRNFGAMLGFGLGLALLSFIPFALVFALPFGVAGAARLTRRIELFEEGERRQAG
jgi:CysZ protein